MYVTDRGQNINKRPNIVYVSTNNTKTWRPLHEFVDVSTRSYGFMNKLSLFIFISKSKNKHKHIHMCCFHLAV